MFPKSAAIHWSELITTPGNILASCHPAAGAGTCLVSGSRQPLLTVLWIVLEGRGAKPTMTASAVGYSEPLSPWLQKRELVPYLATCATISAPIPSEFKIFSQKSRRDLQSKTLLIGTLAAHKSYKWCVLWPSVASHYPVLLLPFKSTSTLLRKDQTKLYQKIQW